MKSEAEAAAICGVDQETLRRIADDILAPVDEYEDRDGGRLYHDAGVEKLREVCFDLDLTTSQQAPTPPKAKAKKGRPKKEAPPPPPAPAPTRIVRVKVTRVHLLNSQMVMGELDGQLVGVRLQPRRRHLIVEGCMLACQHLRDSTYAAVRYPARRGADS